MSVFLIFVCHETPDLPEGSQQLPFITSAVKVRQTSLNDAVDLALLTWTTVTRNASSGFPRLSRSVIEATNPRHLQRLMAMKQMRAGTSDGLNEPDSINKILVVSYENAVKQWQEIEIKAALLVYERWRQSADANQPTPENRECFFLRECDRLARATCEEPEMSPAESEASSVPDTLLVALRRYPRPETLEEWKSLLKAKQVAKIADLEMGSLRQFRYEGEKMANGLFGRDIAGRIWHKQESGDLTVYYVPETLKPKSDCPKRLGAKHQKRQSKRQ